ncbi:MAG: hypothetical protein JKY74_08165 [Shewanella sp.]|nr:hypothetical protein [Shewanella sp.]
MAKIMITGATGLLGRAVKARIEASQVHQADIIVHCAPALSAIGYWFESRLTIFYDIFNF